MKKLLLACSCAMLAFAPGLAANAYADEPGAAPQAPQNDWTGFYAGFNVGYTFGDGDGDTSYLPDPATFGGQPFSSSINLDGFIGGLQAGYNWQSGNYILGVEADVSWSDAHGDDRVSPLSDFGGTPMPAWYQDGSGKMDWFGTLRARAGVLVQPDTLIYATGGLAAGRIEYATFTSFTALPPFQYAGSERETATGWTAGAGAEWAFEGGWSLKAEYLYYDLGETDFTASPLAANPPYEVTQNFETQGNIARLGANFRF